jgi:hypothetical protein
MQRGWVVLDGAKPAARKAALTDEGRRLARRGRWRSDRGSGPAQRWSSAPTAVCAAGSSLSRRCSGRLTLAECDLPPRVVGISNANQNLCFARRTTTLLTVIGYHRLPPRRGHLASVQFPRHGAIAHGARCPEFLNHGCQSPCAQVGGNHVRQRTRRSPRRPELEWRAPNRSWRRKGSSSRVAGNVARRVRGYRLGPVGSMVQKG